MNSDTVGLFGQMFVLAAISGFVGYHLGVRSMRKQLDNMSDAVKAAATQMYRALQGDMVANQRATAGRLNDIEMSIAHVAVDTAELVAKKATKPVVVKKPVGKKVAK